MMSCMRVFILMIVSLGMLSGCGIRPDSLQPPSGEETQFPKTYPQE